MKKLSFSTFSTSLLANGRKGMLLFSAITALSASAYDRVEPRDTANIVETGWDEFTQPLTFTWASKDEVYKQFAPPKINGIVTDTLIHAWRGERIGIEALAIATGEATPEIQVILTPAKNAATGKKAVMQADAAFMRYVLTTDYNTCGYPAADLPVHTVPDLIADNGPLAIEPKSVRPVWCTIEVPANIAPGKYNMKLQLVKAGGKKAIKELGLTIDVAARTLPAPKDYTFYLDMWQQPYAISRYNNVANWSPEHFEAMAPYADMLARAGQKTVSVILFYEPWGEQSHDKFEPMVQTILKADGSWAYDYSVMDAYVDFMAKHGIDQAIECFTMVPWDMNFRYWDEAKGEYAYLKTKTDSPEYEELWTSFLQAFAKHMKEKGWYDKTLIVMDERGLPDMLNAYNVAQKAVPGIKMSLAGNYHPELISELDSYTIFVGDIFPDDILKERRDKGQTSLVYTCCANVEPNLFSNSNPADAAYLPIYSTASGFDGYLHWSFTNWADDPLTDTRFRMFAPGDTYFVYPDNYSSVRYERLVEGVQLSEKVRLLKQELTDAGDIQGLLRLEDALRQVRSGVIKNYLPTSATVNGLQRFIDGL